MNAISILAENVTVDVVSAVASVAGVGVTIWIGVIANRLVSQSARNDVIFQVKVWGDEVVELTASAIAMCQTGGTPNDWTRLASEASGLADKGRLFFPNSGPTAYRAGRRHDAIDLVLVMGDLCRRVSTGAAAPLVLPAPVPPPAPTPPNYHDAFVCLRRAFVDLLYRACDLKRAAPTLAGHLALLDSLKACSLWKAIPPMLQNNTEGTKGKLGFDAPGWKVP